MAALDMQWPSTFGVSQDQTAWPVFVIGIIFNHFSTAKDFSGFLDTDTTNDALVNRVFGELELLGLNFLSYLVDQRHAQFRSNAMCKFITFALSRLTYSVLSPKVVQGT